jgi:DNA-binding transcriptional MerR regulator
MANKAKDAFRTISEVADWLDVPAHVLRFWESKFPQIKPVKRAGGRRYYRPSDMRLIGGIKTLLHDEGITIRGVQKKLKEDGIDAICALSKDVDSDAPAPKIKDVAAKVAPLPEVEEPIEELAPFIDAPEDTSTGGDNVVPMSRRERRRADLEAQAAELEVDENTEQSEHVPEPEPEPAPDPEPEPEPEPEPVVATPEFVEPELPIIPEVAEIAEPQVETTPAPQAPDVTQITASASRRESLQTIGALRRWNPANVKNREEIQFLEHRARMLRDKMAAALKSI